MNAYCMSLRPAIALLCLTMLAACSNASNHSRPASNGAAGLPPEAATRSTGRDGSATVSINNQPALQFKVVQCDWDFPHPILKPQRVQLALTGVHPDTPRDVGLLLASRPDASIDPQRSQQAIATAFAHGPTLSISRLDDGTPSVGLLMSAEQGFYASDGHISISGGTSGARISATVQAEDLDSNATAQLQIEATCP